MHYDHNRDGATVKRLYTELRTKRITLIKWAAAMRAILGV
jgi:hypothetical protein